MPVEQFARVPVSVLFDPNIGPTAKRALVGIAMYRNKAGFARVAVPTIAKMAALNVRNTHKGLRLLESAGAIKSNGRSRQIRTYEICEQRTDKVATCDTSVATCDTSGSHLGHQTVATCDTSGSHLGHQIASWWPPATPFQELLSRKASKKINQEKNFRKKCQAPNAFRPQMGQSLFAANTPKMILS